MNKEENYKMYFNFVLKNKDLYEKLGKDKTEKIIRNIVIHNNKKYNEETFYLYMQNYLQLQNQKEILADNLKKYMDIRGYNVNTLANKLDMSYSTVNDWVNAVSYPRANRIQELCTLFNINTQQLTEKHNGSINTVKSIQVPVLGRIPAGIPIEAIEDIIDYETLPSTLANSDKEFFALKIKGNSMYPTYNDGDVVIFERASDCESGSHCAVMVNGDDATFKKVVKNELGIILVPLNEEYEPVFYSNKQIKELPVRVVGIAREIRRKLSF